MQNTKNRLSERPIIVLAGRPSLTREERCAAAALEISQVLTLGLFADT
jgi:hypothetical protein